MIQNIEYIDTTLQELQEFLQKSDKKTDINFEESELAAFFSDAKSVKLLSKEIDSLDDESVGFLFRSVGDESRDRESLKISIVTLLDTTHYYHRASASTREDVRGA